MQLLIKTILRYKLLFLAIVLVCTLFAIILLPQLRLNSEYINLLPPKPEHLEISEDVLSTTTQDSKDVYCLFEGNAIFSMQALNALQGVLAELEAIEGLRPPLSALSFITFQKKGTRLASIALNPNKNNEPFTEESAALFAQRLRTDRIARGLLSTEDGDSLLIQLSFQPDTEYSNEIFDAIAHTLDRLRAYGSISLVGTPLFEERVQQYLTYDLERLLLLCLLVIVLMFFLAFRSKRAVIIPLSLSVIALLWTLAVMVLLDYELTVVNIIVPSMVLILGSSYAIHILSEYFQTIKADNTMEEKEERIILAVGRISKTIFGASLTTIVGFLSLVLCELQAFRELGLAVSIGISFCALLSLIYIPSLLAILPNPKQQHLRRFTHGRISKTLHQCSIAF
ncbi:MAG: efflux RND transporter permease subunit, partial [Sphaerochaeta sp.]